MTAPVPHWPGRLTTLDSGEQVWLAATPSAVSPSPEDAQDARDAQDAQDAPGAQRTRDLVVCVHGMTGASTNWTDLMAELAPDFDCVALDLPGSGFSPPPAKRSGYSLKALAKTVISLIETITQSRTPRRTDSSAGSPDNRRPVHLIGNSMGGAIAIRVAAARPDLVRTLTLVSPVLPDRRPHRTTLHFPVLALPVLGDRLAQRFSLLSPVNRVAGVYGMCYFDSSVIDQDRLTQAVAELRRRDALAYQAESLVGAARTLVAETLRPRRLSLWQAAERIEVPSLVLFGSHDRLVSPALAAPAARAFRSGRIVVLPETGHIAQMERPALVAELFREMVDRAHAAAGAGNSGRRDSVDA
jgi:pimeloyl-ACP methyl ester carboxylesterase